MLPKSSGPVNIAVPVFFLSLKDQPAQFLFLSIAFVSRKHGRQDKNHRRIFNCVDCEDSDPLFSLHRSLDAEHSQCPLSRTHTADVRSGSYSSNVINHRRSIMSSNTGRLGLATVMLLIGFGVGGRAEAGGSALSTPAGLSPGDSFRFVFVTDGTTTAVSSDISTYDAFVQAQAGGATYEGATVTWKAIGSTASVNAIDHVGQTDTPVYLADGTQVTTSTTTSGLWSGILENPIDKDLNGNLYQNVVWTGTAGNGTETPTNPLGAGNDSSFFSTIGATAFTTSDWTDFSTAAVPQEIPMYGISQVLTVVPEPSGLIMLGTALGAVLGVGTYRRSRHSRRKGAVEVPPTRTSDRTRTPKARPASSAPIAPSPLFAHCNQRRTYAPMWTRSTPRSQSRDTRSTQRSTARGPIGARQRVPVTSAQAAECTTDKTCTVIAHRHSNRQTLWSVSVSDPPKVIRAVEVLVRAFAMAVVRRLPGLVQGRPTWNPPRPATVPRDKNGESRGA
jgi:hypothetical protein